LMAIPIAVGYLCARVASASARGNDARNWAAWLSTAEGSETVLIGFAVLIMSIGLALTTSRSGILALAVALAVARWHVLRMLGTTGRRLLLLLYLPLLLLTAVAWAGGGKIAARFEDATYGNRIPIALDALRLARRFPLTGTGLNTYGTATLAYQTVIPDVHLAQAHNDYVQLV